MRAVSRKDVFYLPMYYRTGWSDAQNRLLCGVFPHAPLQKIPPMDFHASRKLLHAVLSNEWDRIRKARVVLFGNLQKDFFFDLLQLPNTEHAGFFREVTKDSSPSLWRNDGPEDEVARLARAVLCPSRIVADRAPGEANTVITGSPIYTPYHKPVLEDAILWNHRMAMNKGWGLLPELPDGVKRRLIVSTPQATSAQMRAIGGGFLAKALDPPSGVYRQFEGKAGYVLHTGKGDSFCYAVMEGVWAGRFALGRRGNGYSELLPDEMIYETKDELVEKIEYFDANPEERTRVVHDAQRMMEAFTPERWLERVVRGVGAEW